jgi:hypothetical protein
MIWFFEAAHKVVSTYDAPNDHDGPRHFEYGLGLMVGKILELVALSRGMNSAADTAHFIIGRVEDWKLYGHVKLEAARKSEAQS